MTSVNRVEATDLRGVESDLHRALVNLRWHRHQVEVSDPRFDRLVDAESYVEDAIRAVEKVTRR